MEKIKIETQTTRMLADTYTPVGIYLRLRDIYPNCLLLESSDFHTSENSWSFICLKPIITFRVNHGNIEIIQNDEVTTSEKISNPTVVAERLNDFIEAFKPSNSSWFNGLYGYTAYDAVQYFEQITLDQNKNAEFEVPHIQYSAYQFIIGINHYNDELIICENLLADQVSEINQLQAYIAKRSFTTYPFNLVSEEKENTTDAEFLSMIDEAKNECIKGNVIQMVLSRRYSRQFTGDDFNVYRMLRSVNPSPYLFYFDFGSSPETHLHIKDGKASINPIAGTYKRSGNDETDRILAENLKNDPKENAEHVMLVDLARNDLSRYANQVKVEVYKEIQFYSHVIHLVSKVSGVLKNEKSIIDLYGSTFPAGTLSGAPKYMAMKLIDKLEKSKRSFYGGAVGFISFDKHMNHAITIRSILSTQNHLHYQAGAGIVAASDSQSELQEVTNKLGALRKALSLANNQEL